MVPCFRPADAVRDGELDSLGDRAGYGGDFVDVSAPAVMCKGGNGGCKGNGGGEHDCVQAHDILLSWTGGLYRNPWVTSTVEDVRRPAPRLPDSIARR